MGATANMDNKTKISSNAVNPEVWFEKYRDSLFKYALSRLRDADLAEESIQETFLAALQSRKDFQGLAAEKTWLISILKRKICDHFRRISRDKQFNVTSSMKCLRYDAFDCKRMLSIRSSIWFFDPARVYEQKEFLKVIKHALSELPGRLAQVFILREVIELSSQEISEFMDISICNLYVMMHRARKRLKHNLQLKWFCETEKSNDLKVENGVTV
jgi:RNA polymerase sigma-70 factor (ECF subfamily)